VANRQSFDETELRDYLGQEMQNPGGNRGFTGIKIGILNKYNIGR